MRLALKNRNLIKLIILLSIGAFTGIAVFLGTGRSVWHAWDYKALDMIYRQAVEHGYGPRISPRIVYITLTDSTYNYFNKNILDRSDIARVNDALRDLGVEAVAFDIIFARPGEPESDRRFTSSIRQLGSVYLPIGLSYAEGKRSFRWESSLAYDRFRSDYLRRPREKGSPDPFYAIGALMQSDAISAAAFNSGHISAYCDPDGVYRHIVMLLKVDDLFFPTLTLSMFLDYAGVSFRDMVVHWGEKIVIPSTKSNLLDNDVIIPIDEQGRTFIPFVRTWDKDFKKMEAHALLQYFENENLRGNLTDFFEGKFVFIGDVSIGTSDLGQTPLESDVPLIVTHTAMLNGLLNNTFYHKTAFRQIFLFMFLIACLLCISAFPKSSWFLYGTGAFVLTGLVGWTWFQFTRFYLFPVVTTAAGFLFILSALVIGIEISVSKHKAFIKSAFSRYVPEKVVKHLLDNPELLTLGGEERVITVLFSDLENFTAISENMTPRDLASLLNAYLTEMTRIVLAEGGIIDKYEGDAIMAEFGAPIPAPDHADMAVRTGLRMQRRLQELRADWSQKGLPAMRCRIGINTGSMIIGNMGSNQVFDYTVIGDAVNLASRLEGANKHYNTFFMISESTREHLTPEAFKTRILDVITVKGKTEAVKVFEVYGEASEQTAPEDEQYYRTYHEAFEAYLSRDFSRAADKFNVCLSLRPDDPAAENMISRIAALDPDQLPDDWDGSVALLSK